jgi:hypothetical protein
MYVKVNLWINMSGLSRGLPSNAVPDLGRAPMLAGTHVCRNAAKDFADCERNSRSSLAGRRNDRKNSSSVITLAGSLSVSGSGGFRLLTRSR